MSEPNPTQPTLRLLEPRALMAADRLARGLDERSAPFLRSLSSGVTRFSERMFDFWVGRNEERPVTRAAARGPQQLQFPAPWWELPEDAKQAARMRQVRPAWPAQGISLPLLERDVSVGVSQAPTRMESNAPSVAFGTHGTHGTFGNEEPRARELIARYVETSLPAAATQVEKHDVPDTESRTTRAPLASISAQRSRSLSAQLVERLFQVDAMVERVSGSAPRSSSPQGAGRSIGKQAPTSNSSEAAAAQRAPAVTYIAAMPESVASRSAIGGARPAGNVPSVVSLAPSARRMNAIPQSAADLLAPAAPPQIGLRAALPSQAASPHIQRFIEQLLGPTTLSRTGELPVARAVPAFAREVVKTTDLAPAGAGTRQLPSNAAVVAAARAAATDPVVGSAPFPAQGAAALQQGQTSATAPLVENRGATIAEIAQPSVAQASVAQASVAQPSVAQASVAQPSVAQPSVAVAEFAQASVTEASVAQASVAQASVTEASVAQASVAQASVALPTVMAPDVALARASSLAKESWAANASVAPGVKLPNAAVRFATWIGERDSAANGRGIGYGAAGADRFGPGRLAQGAELLANIAEQRVARQLGLPFAPARVSSAARSADAFAWVGPERRSADASGSLERARSSSSIGLGRTAPVPATLRGDTDAAAPLRDAARAAAAARVFLTSDAAAFSLSSSASSATAATSSPARAAQPSGASGHASAPQAASMFADGAARDSALGLAAGTRFDSSSHGTAGLSRAAHPTPMSIASILSFADAQLGSRLLRGSEPLPIRMPDIVYVQPDLGLGAASGNVSGNASGSASGNAAGSASAARSGSFALSSNLASSGEASRQMGEPQRADSTRVELRTTSDFSSLEPAPSYGTGQLGLRSERWAGEVGARAASLASDFLPLDTESTTPARRAPRADISTSEWVLLSLFPSTAMAQEVARSVSSRTAPALSYATLLGAPMGAPVDSSSGAGEQAALVRGSSSRTAAGVSGPEVMRQGTGRMTSLVPMSSVGSADSFEAPFSVAQAVAETSDGSTPASAGATGPAVRNAPTLSLLDAAIAGDASVSSTVEYRAGVARARPALTTLLPDGRRARGNRVVPTQGMPTLHAVAAASAAAAQSGNGSATGDGSDQSASAPLWGNRQATRRGATTPAMSFASGAVEPQSPSSSSTRPVVAPASSARATTSASHAAALELVVPYVEAARPTSSGAASFTREATPSVPAQPSDAATKSLMSALSAASSGTGQAGGDRLSLADLTLISIISSTNQVAAATSGTGVAHHAQASTGHGAASAHGGAGGKPDDDKEVELIAERAFDRLVVEIRQYLDNKGEPWER